MSCLKCIQFGFLLTIVSVNSLLKVGNSLSFAQKVSFVQEQVLSGERICRVFLWFLAKHGVEYIEYVVVGWAT